MAQSNKQNKTLKNNLADLVVTDNWMEQTGPFLYVKVGQESMGPFRAHELKEYLDHSPLPSDTLIRDAKSTGNWSSLYQHPYFQRRKPSLVVDSQQDQRPQGELQFYYLDQGKPCGPFNSDEMAQMIESKKLISTNMISIDRGHTWMKLYQLSSFDRRTYSASELPMSPQQKDEGAPGRGPLKKLRQQTDALLNLAFIQSVKAINSAKAGSRENDQHQGPDTSDDSSTSSSKALLLLLFLAAVAAAYFFLTPQDRRSQATRSQRGKQATTVKSTSKTTTRKATKAKTATAKRRMMKKSPARSAATSTATPRPAKLPSRKPKSFTSTPVYQERHQAQDPPEEEDRYYDDGMDAIELDPIRKAVSKETFAPEEEPQDSYVEEDIYLDEEQEPIDDGEMISVEDVWGDAKSAAPTQEESDGYGDDYYQ